jgi:hypothetical protein
MDVLVISGGSSRQRFDERPVSCREIDETPREELVGEHPDAAAPAADLYTGREHARIEAAVDDLEAVTEVTWRLLSPGYGVVGPEDELVAYDCSISDVDALRARADRLGLAPGEMTRRETRAAVARSVGMYEAVREALSTGPDLALIALPSDLLTGIGPALERIPDGTTAIAIAAASATDSLGDCHWLPATDTERTLLEANWVTLRGDLLAGLADGITSRSDLDRIAERPQRAYFTSLGMD